MDLLDKMATFVRVIEAGSFSAAARQLHLSPAAVSRQIASLEGELRVALLLRSTRRMTITPAGHRYYERCVRIRREVDEAQAIGRGEAVEGLLQVTTSVTFGLGRVVPHMASLMARYPGLRIHLRIEDHLLDLALEGVDVAIRVGHTLPESTQLVAHPLGAFLRLLVASPEYLKRCGEPKTPESLARHDALTHDTGADSWTFRNGEREVRVRPSVTFRSNSLHAIHELARSGRGVALLPDWLIAEDLDRRTLRRLLPTWEPGTVPVNAVHRTELRSSPRVRALIDHLRAAYAATPRAPDPAASVKGQGRVKGQGQARGHAEGLGTGRGTPLMPPLDLAADLLIARDPRSPPSLLRGLLSHEAAAVREAVAGNPNTPLDLLLRLAASPATPPGVLRLLAASARAVVRCEVAGNPALPEECAASLAEDPRSEVRVAVARSTLRRETLEALARSRGPYERLFARARLQPTLVGGPLPPASLRGASLALVVDGYPGDLPVAEPILTRELGGVLELLWPVASPDEQLDCLGAALASAHGALCRACKDQGVRFTSVTVAALLICGDQAHLAHVGDGRIYRFRAGRLEPLTSDHNVSDLLFARLPVGDNFMNDLHYGFNNPTIGKDFDALIEDRKTVAIEPGDRFLLCTSYLFIVIEPDQAEAILTAHADDAAAMQALVEAARVACDQDLPTPRVVLITARAGQRAP